MAWNTLTIADVTNELTPIEVQTLQGIAGSESVLQAILTNVIGKVRGQIKAGGNQVDQSDAQTVPDQLAGEVIAITRWRWLNSLPGLKDDPMLSDGRKKAAEDAEAMLRDIASMNPNRPRVELPATADTTAAPVIGPSTGDSKRVNFTGITEDGI